MKTRAQWWLLLGLAGLATLILSWPASERAGSTDPVLQAVDGETAMAEPAAASPPQPQPQDEPAADLPDPVRPYIGKPRPPLDVRPVGVPSLQAGVPARVALEIRSGVDVEGLELRLEGDAGLTVVSPQPLRLAALAAGEAARVDVAVTPTSGGTRRLSGFLAFTVQGEPQGMPVNLTVQVSGPDVIPVPLAKPQAAPEVDAKGEPIYSMPAETTVVGR